MEAHAHAQHDHAAHAHGGHEHHALPTSGRALTGVAVSATLHCLTGCAIGEIAGMAIGTALGFSQWGTVALAVALAFLFGYALTSLPLLRAGLTVSTVIPIALAFALSVAFVVALPVNRWLIARGKGHAAVHRTGIHGGPNPRTVGAILAVAFVFGTTVLVIEALNGDDGDHPTTPHVSLMLGARP